MAATGRVWDGVVDSLAGRWPGRIVVPDLSGHGRSPRLARYSFGAIAADVAALVGPDDDVVAVGHSMGGVVALALGSGWFGCRVVTAVAASVKVRWSGDELARAAAVAAKPVTWFDTEVDAVERYLRVSGLSSLVAPSSPVALDGIVESDGRFRLANDPITASVGAPDMAGLLTASRARVVLACGSADHMVASADLLELEPATVVLDGIGHNAHVEAPAMFADLIVHQLSEM
jgi:pimeloyl-ACP methyl ester carboxylesterase